MKKFFSWRVVLVVINHFFIYKFCDTILDTFNFGFFVLLLDKIKRHQMSMTYRELKI